MEKKIEFSPETGAVVDFTPPSLPAKYKITITCNRAQLARMVLGMIEWQRKEKRNSKRRKDPYKGQGAACYAMDVSEFVMLQEGLTDAIMRSKKGTTGGDV